MRCLRAILGVTHREQLRNDNIRQALNMKCSISEVIIQKWLRWLGHVTRCLAESYITQAYRRTFPNPRPSGRPPNNGTPKYEKIQGCPYRLQNAKVLTLVTGFMYVVLSLYVKCLII